MFLLDFAIEEEKEGAGRGEVWQGF